MKQSDLKFSRTMQLLSKNAMEKIQKAKVAVFGLGGVGSFATEAIVRTGVKNICLVDFDTIDISNINRQLLALHSSVGKQKVLLAKERIKDINPEACVKVYNSFVNKDSLENLLSKDFDVVVDAIDGLNSKINLLEHAILLNLDVVSSMGASGRTDISMIRTGDISETSVCPLARVVRQRLHRRGIYKGIRAVYSIEKPLNKNYLTIEQENKKKEHGRKRHDIGSISWVPGIFGLTIASEVINIIMTKTKA